MPQEELADRLHSAAIHLLRRVAAVDGRTGLSPARLSALSVVVYAGSISMTALARAERVSAATMSSTVAGLEAAGLVTRCRAPDDGRTVMVQATDRGRQVLVEGRRRRVAQLAAGLADLPETDRAALERGVAVLEALLRTQPAG
ncbi:MAG TPA: MarR family transcriptional regulator [Natronosporangium sp.]